MTVPGTPGEKMLQRVREVGADGDAPGGNPVIFRDFYGAQGRPMRTTISEVGPTLLARMLGLTDVQKGVLEVIFRLADEQGLSLPDLEDLRALLPLERQGGKEFSGKPALELSGLMRPDLGGRGILSILAPDRYGTILGHGGVAVAPGGAK